MAVTDTSAAKKCAVCGKEFVVLYQDLWRYRRGEKWLCTWKCLREYDKKGVKHMGKPKKLSKDQRMKAIQICIDGGDPLKYLAECGVGSPRNQWQRIRGEVRDTDPELYQKIPNLRWKKQTKKIETPESEIVKGPVTPDELYETFNRFEDLKPIDKEPEDQKITQPLNYDGMKVREVEGDFGRYRRKDVRGTVYIDFEYLDGVDTISLTDDQWRSWRKEQERAVAILGVEL